MSTNQLNIKKSVSFYTSLMLLMLALVAQPAIGQTSFCKGDSLWLNVGSSFVGEIQWQQSSNGSFFTDITGGIGNPYKIYLTTSKYYRARLNNNTCLPIYSDTFYITSSVPGQFLQSTSAEFSLNTTSGLDTTGDNVTLIPTGTLTFGTGSNGAFHPSGDTSIAGGTYNFTSFTIDAGDTVFVTGSNPLIILSSGGTTINGVLFLSGKIGGEGFNNGAPGAGGAGGGGGGAAGGVGGTGGLSTALDYSGANGSGPGGGKGGITEYVSTLDGQGGGGAGFDTTGGNSYHAGGGGGIGGQSYGSATLVPLLGGSGGGGGAGDDDTPGVSTGDDGGGGGGGGGGAVKITTPILNVGSNGAIESNGGLGGPCGNGGSGGGGSGGSIYLECYSLNNGGDITAEGGISTTSQLANSIGGTGSDGRLRFDYISYVNSGTVAPAVGYTTSTGTYNSNGTMTSGVISPSVLCAWGDLTYDVDTSLAGVTLKVDILNSTGTLIASDVASGTDLSTIPAVAAVSALRLRLTLSTTVSTSSPVLNEWKLKYYTK